MASAGVLAMAAVAPAPADGQDSSPTSTTVPGMSYVESEIGTDTPNFRTAIMADKSIYVCFTSDFPEPVDLDGDDVPEFVVVQNADCAEILPTGEFEIFTDTTRAISVMGNAEIIEIVPGASLRPIFLDVVDTTEVFQ